MSNWKEYRLGDCIEFIIDNRGKNPPLSDNGYELIETISINSENKYPDYSKISKFVSKDTYNNWFRKGHPKKGDILISTVGANIGRVSIMNENRGCIAQNLIGLRTDKEKLIPDYLYYFLIKKSTQHTLSSLNIGSAQPSIKVPHLLNILINVPNIQKQEEIANILSSLDEKIELNTQINQTLEQIAQALFKSWFVDFDPVRAKVQALSDGLSLEQAELAAMQAISGKTPKELTALSQTQPDHYAELAETAKAFPCEMVEVDGVEVPMGWEVLNANDVIEFNPKEPLKKDTLAYYLDMASLPTQGCSPDLPILRKFTSGTRFRNGDTLFARITPCLENGKTAFIQYLPEGTVAWGSTEYIVMRTKGIIPKPYSYLLARYESFREYAIRSMTGTSGRQRTQLDIIETYKVVSPSDNKLWESFSKIINPIFETINSNTNKNITLSNIRDLLLPKLLNGDIQNE